MRSKVLMLVGILFVAAGVTGLVHPQWQGQDKRMEVDIGSKNVVVTTRRVTDIPPLLAWAVIVAGACTVALGAITQEKK